MTHLFSSGIFFRRYIRASLPQVFISLLLVALAFSSCKDPDKLGLDVQPASDQLSVLYSDTATLLTRVVREDSLFSTGLTYQLLGSYDDPVFGISNADFYTQVELGLSPTLGASTDVLVADSLVLSLAYSYCYGDTNSTLTAHVFRINQDISADTAYYTTKVFSDSGADLANSFQFKPNPTGQVLRIPLPIALADTLVALNGQAPYTDNNSWISYFKGLHITVDPQTISGQGAIAAFDLFNNASSALTLYYRNITTSNDTLHYSFSLKTLHSVTHTSHDYSGSDAGHQLTDSTYKDTISYLQPMAGLKTKITFPFLKSFIAHNAIAVNKAELEITVPDGTFDVFAVPSALFLGAIQSDGSSVFLADVSQGLAYFGGAYNTAAHTYTFNISRHIQRILTGQITDYGLYLVVNNGSIQANRVIVGSGKNPTHRMKLNFYYTKLP